MSRRKVNSKIKSNVKGNGQECPFHTGNINTNSKINSYAAGVRGSHSSQKRRRMGHPLLFLRTLSKAKATCQEQRAGRPLHIGIVYWAFM